jgi:hypothetical protein
MIFKIEDDHVWVFLNINEDTHDWLSSYDKRPDNITDGVHEWRDVDTWSLAIGGTLEHWHAQTFPRSGGWQWKPSVVNTETLECSCGSKLDKYIYNQMVLRTLE